MKKWIGVMIGVVALLVGMTGGYLLSPDVTLWMAEMETGEALAERWQESCSVLSRMRHDQRVLAEMETNPAYAVLAVEELYPFVRIVNVENHGHEIEIWMYLADLTALYPETDARNQARLDATATTIKLAHEAFPDVPKFDVYWASYPMAVRSIERKCYAMAFDVSIRGGAALLDWAEKPDLEAIVALGDAGEIQIVGGGWFTPKYCEGALERLSNDPHPWEGDW